jgi:hypothetical protein
MFLLLVSQLLLNDQNVNIKAEVQFKTFKWNVRLNCDQKMLSMQEETLNS